MDVNVDLVDDIVPERLFHLTSLENAIQIRLGGFHGSWGNYFSSSIDAACRFVVFRALGSPDTQWIALEVDTKNLPFERSNDHSVEFFGTDDSWVTFSSVPTSAIVAAYEVDLGLGA